MSIKNLSLIVPCYNEEKIILKGIYSFLKTIKENKDYNIDLIIVDDGSTDNSIEVIKKIREENNARSIIKIVKLSKNYGFHIAVTAGIEFAKKSDAVILVVGGSRRTGGEGVDRSDLNLYGVQNELIKAIHKTGKPVIVVLMNGRPLTINYIADNIPSILETWYLGMHSGDAIADAIFGDVNPGGKLTVSFPRSVGC